MRLTVRPTCGEKSGSNDLTFRSKAESRIKMGAVQRRSPPAAKGQLWQPDPHFPGGFAGALGE